MNVAMRTARFGSRTSSAWEGWTGEWAETAGFAAEIGRFVKTATRKARTVTRVLVGDGKTQHHSEFRGRELAPWRSILRMNGSCFFY